MMRAMSMVWALILLGTVAIGAEDKKEEPWRRIFDGERLKDWKPNERPKNWGVEDGAIVGRGTRSHLYYMAEKLEDFEIKTEVMINEGGNSGIYFHVPYHDGGWFGDGHEVQINNTHGDPVKTGSLWGVVKLYESPVKDDEWFKVHIAVKGQNIVVRINGKIVMDYTEPKCVGHQGVRHIGKGYIAFQQHDPGSSVKYRNIMLKTPAKK